MSFLVFCVCRSLQTEAPGSKPLSQRRRAPAVGAGSGRLAGGALHWLPQARGSGVMQRVAAPILSVGARLDR